MKALDNICPKPPQKVKSFECGKRDIVLARAGTLPTLLY